MQKHVSSAEFMRDESAQAEVGGLLVTGGTGLIGGAVLAELFDSPLWARTLIMVRAENIETARKRIIHSIARFEPEGDVAGGIRDEQIIVADLEDASRLEQDERMQSVTHVIHSAAVTSFSKHPRIRAVNVDASLEFARVLMQTAELKRFLYVGSAWCVGLGNGQIVPEGTETPVGAHLIPYTESKLEFEREARARFPTLPFVSARPSIVVGHTQLGTTPSGSIYWVFRSGALLGQFTCALDDRIDVVPVDWTAMALVHLAIKPTLNHDVYHLSAGAQAASSYGQLDEAIARGRNVAPHGPVGYRHIDDAQLVQAVYREKATLGDVNPFLLSRALVLYGRFASSGVLFENDRALAEGVPPPPPFFSYADICAATAERSSIWEQMEADFKC